MTAEEKLKRIPRVVKKLESIWSKHSDLRLCQLIGNCYPAGDNYYRSDLEQKLIETYGKEVNNGRVA